MNIITTIQSTVRFAAILAIGLTAIAAATTTDASAAGSCPGGGTQKCSFSCTGPVTKPVCQEVNCTCSISNKVGTKVLAQSRGPLINVPPRPPIKVGGASRFR